MKDDRTISCRTCSVFLKLPLLIGTLALLLSAISVSVEAASFDTIEDLSGKAIPLIALKSQDNFSNELTYEVRIRNRTGTPFIAESLIIVLDKVTNIGGFEREALKKEPLINKIEVVDQDGTTADGKAYFHIPTGGKEDLPPFSQSLPVTIRIRNPSYVTGLTPAFRIYGTIRLPEKEEAPRRAKPTVSPSSKKKKKKDGDKFRTLLQLLIKKGVISKEEWKEATTPPSGPQPLAPIQAPGSVAP